MPSSSPAVIIPASPATLATSPTNTPTSQAVGAQSKHPLETVWRTGDKLDRLQGLSGLTTDSHNNLYFSEQWHRLVRKYDPKGHLLFELKGFPPGSFNIPGPLATDREDNLYVAAISGEAVIYKFDPNGKLLFSFCSRPPTLGLFRGTSGLAVDENGLVYVLDNVGRVYTFDRAGKYLTTWGNPIGQDDPAKNTTPPRLASPVGLVADQRGHIYIADFTNYRVLKFSVKGQFLTAWGSSGKGPVQFGNYTTGNGLAVDLAGNVYVADPSNQRVEKFTPEGRFVAEWGRGFGQQDGQFWWATAVAVDQQNSVYITDQGNERVQKFDQVGSFLSKLGRQDLGEGALDAPSGIGLGPKGEVYVADSLTRYIQKFDASGQFVLQWGVQTQATTNRYLDRTLHLAVDQAGDVYVSDSYDDYVKKYDSVGHFLFSWGGTGAKPGQFVSPTSPVFDATDNLYIADSGNKRVQKFDKEGHFLLQLDFNPTATSQSEQEGHFPIAMTIDPQNNIYIAFSGCGCIRKYDSAGGFILEWGPPPKGTKGISGQSLVPTGLAVDGQGSIYVMDMGNFHCSSCRVQKFDAKGQFVANWESLFNSSPLWAPLVAGNGEFTPISAIAVDKAGNLYLAEAGEGRVSKFRQL
jgi:DNA-binding beta-propeller fold protein YncE